MLEQLFGGDAVTYSDATTLMDALAAYTIIVGWENMPEKLREARKNLIKYGKMDTSLIGEGTSKEAPKWNGSGPVEGVIGVNGNSTSVKSLQNYNPKDRGLGKTVEFVFDAETNTFVVGKPTNEFSGHFGVNWTPELRIQFQDTMENYGIKVIHEAYGG